MAGHRFGFLSLAATISLYQRTSSALKMASVDEVKVGDKIPSVVLKEGQARTSKALWKGDVFRSRGGVCCASWGRPGVGLLWRERLVVALA